MVASSRESLLQRAGERKSAKLIDDGCSSEHQIESSSLRSSYAHKFHSWTLHFVMNRSSVFDKPHCRCWRIRAVLLERTNSHSRPELAAVPTAGKQMRRTFAKSLLWKQRERERERERSTTLASNLCPPTVAVWYAGLWYITNSQRLYLRLVF